MLVRTVEAPLSESVEKQSDVLLMTQDSTNLLLQSGPFLLYKFANIEGLIFLSITRISSCPADMKISD